MRRFVLDCSVAMAWCFEDETSLYARFVLRRFATDEVSVPSIWPLEIANAILVGERRKRISQADSTQFLGLLRSLQIVFDESVSERIWTEVLSLAREHALSSYDAAYLELAMRSGAALATLDESLRNVANQVEVEILQP